MTNTKPPPTVCCVLGFSSFKRLCTTNTIGTMSLPHSPVNPGQHETAPVPSCDGPWVPKLEFLPRS
ncbi:hypothetical protein K440DRAFT_621035 [Wilcoxina mikolae CBS 423.85]|nr:hypothetical protein K440DRAFT_621035 [Wilcoxina mikolae CBS 423.85]